MEATKPKTKKSVLPANNWQISARSEVHTTNMMTLHNVIVTYGEISAWVDSNLSGPFYRMGSKSEW